MELETSRKEFACEYQTLYETPSFNLFKFSLMSRILTLLNLKKIPIKLSSDPQHWFVNFFFEPFNLSSDGGGLMCPPI